MSVVLAFEQSSGNIYIDVAAVVVFSGLLGYTVASLGIGTPAPRDRLIRAAAFGVLFDILALGNLLAGIGLLHRP